MPANAQKSKANYSVKSVETVVAGADVQARMFTLAPGEVIPWHYHGKSTDHYFVLEGVLSISQIAWLVGYQGVSAFSHGYKRWTGMNPKRMRGKLLASH